MYKTAMLLSFYRKTPANVNGYFFLKKMYKIQPLDYREKYAISV